jgi:prepilin-type N-terminal cleavage/methylation domain-containing protein
MTFFTPANFRQRRTFGSRRAKRQGAGFTLVEMLVTIAIISLLIAVLVPAINAARSAARRMQCQSQLRQLALGVLQHEAALQRYPPGKFQGPYGEGPDSRAWGWLAHTLPYLEEQTLYNAGKIPHATLAESQVVQTQLPLLLCPVDAYARGGPRTDAGNLDGFAVGQTNYKAVLGANWGADKSQQLDDIGTDWRNRGVNGSFDGQDEADGIMYRTDYKVRPRPESVLDGLSKTLMIGEVLPEKDRWTSWAYANNAYATCAIPPNVAPRRGSSYHPLWWPNSLAFRSAHPGGVGFALADGSTHFVNDQIDLTLYRALATIGGGEDASLAE